MAFERVWRISFNNQNNSSSLHLFKRTPRSSSIGMWQKVWNNTRLKLYLNVKHLFNLLFFLNVVFLTSWSEKLLLKIPEKIQPTLTKDISQIIFNEYFIKISLKYHVLSVLSSVIYSILHLLPVKVLISIFRAIWLESFVFQALKFQIPVFIWKPMPTLSGTPQRFMNLNWMILVHFFPILDQLRK